MAFTQRLSDIDLVSSALAGMTSSRKELWSRTLDECKKEFEERGLSETANNSASHSIESLRDKSSAGTHSPPALSISRYVGEGLMRSILSMAYEDKLPFEWSCNLSAAFLQEVMIRITSLLGPMCHHAKSRLLPSFPISVVAAVMDAIANSGAHNLSWWSESNNMRSIIRKAKNFAKGFSGRVVSDKDKNIIKSAAYLFREGIVCLGALTGAKDFSSFHNRAVLKMENIINGKITEPENRMEVSSSMVPKPKALEIWRFVLEINFVLRNEMGLFFIAQDMYLSAKKESDITNVCRNVFTKQGEDFVLTQMVFIDNILLDLAYLFSDMYQAISFINSEANEKDVGHLMTVLAEPWNLSKICNHRKLLMLSIALMEGVETSKVGNNLLINAIMEKLKDGGSFSTTRKKRVKLTARQSKRAPKLQPRVIYSRLLSDSEDEYTSGYRVASQHSRRQRRKRLKITQKLYSSSELEDEPSPSRRLRENTEYPTFPPRSMEPAPHSTEPALRSTEPAPRSTKPALRSTKLGPRRLESPPRTPEYATLTSQSPPRTAEPAPPTLKYEPPINQSTARTTEPKMSNPFEELQNETNRKRESLGTCNNQTRNRKQKGSLKEADMGVLMEECGLDSPLRDESSPLRKKRTTQVHFLIQQNKQTMQEQKILHQVVLA